MSASFPVKSDLPKADQAEIDRINALPSNKRSAGETAYLNARAIYLTNQIIETDSSGNITRCAGNTVPTSGLSGFAKSCVFVELDAGAGVAGTYYNNGTTASSNFQAAGSGGGGGGSSVSAVVVVATDGSGDYNCDGTADEVQINQALASLGSAGGTVMLKAGTYNISDSILIDSYQQLVGVNSGASIIRAANSLNKDMIVTPTTQAINKVVIKDLKIDGNRGGNTSGKGIYLFSPRHCLIEDVWLLETEEQAIYLAGDSNNLGWFNTIHRNHIDLCDDGIEFRFCEHNWVQGNTISWIVGKGLWCRSDMDYILDNQFDHCGGYTIHCYFGAGLWTISRNSIDRPQDHGVVLEGADRSVVMDNYFDSAVAGKASIVNNASDKVIISGNRMTQTGGAGSYGIQETGATDLCRYTNNIITGAPTALALHASSTNLVCKDNTGAGNSDIANESPASGSINGSNTIFTFSHTINLITLNGQIQQDGVDVTISGKTATFATAPGPGNTIENYYLS